jgi:hypothetical protein
MALAGNDKLLQTYWRDDILRGIPISARAYRTSQQALTGGAYNTISYHATRWNDYVGTALWVAGAPTRMTISIPGVYSMTFNGQMPSSTAGGQLFLYINNATVIAKTIWTANPLHISSEYKFAAGEFVEVLTYPVSNMSIGFAAMYECEFTVTKVA